MQASEKWTSKISTIASAGYYVALRVGFAFPAREYNTFSDNWKSFYVQNGLMTKDPTIQWAYRNTGIVRISDLAKNDDHGVLQLAAQHGMRFGAVVGFAPKAPNGQRSFGIFYNRDREFTDLEIESVYETVETLHLGATLPKLSRAEVEALAFIRDGYRLKEAAHFIGITESAVKARLISAKQKLGARNSTHAAALASDFGLLIS